MKGWGRNRAAATRKDKSALLGKIEALDSIVDLVGLAQSGWDQLFCLEALLMDLHFQEEAY